MDITIVAAIAQNGAIGRRNGLPWQYIKEDMRHFRDVTLGKTCVIGRRTLDSIGRYLPGRKIICVSSQPRLDLPGVTWAANPLIALDYARYQAMEDNLDEIMIIGGRSLYEQLFRYATKAYITWVHEEPEADVFWQPDFTHWQEIGSQCYQRCTITTLCRTKVESEQMLRIPLELR